MNRPSTNDQDAVRVLVHRLEDWCREYPWTALSVSFGVGLGLGASAYSAIAARTFWQGLRRLSGDAHHINFSKLSFASLATEIAVNALADRLRPDQVAARQG